MDPAIYRQMREVEDRHWWFVSRRSIVETLIRSINLPQGARILDIGAGTGGNLAMLTRYGIVTGVEPDTAAAAIASSRSMAPVLAGSLPDSLPDLPGKFDLIVMLDVLEHIDNDLESLRTAGNLLAHGGTIILTVPAFPFLWSDHDTLHHHKRRYRAAGLKRLLLESGLQARRLSYYNYWLFPVIACLRMLRPKGHPETVARDVALPPAFLNRILTSIFSSERYFITRSGFPFGTSLIAIADKGLPEPL